LASDVTNLNAALEEAAAEEEVSEESSTEEKDASAEEDGKERPKSKGAQARIRELVDARKKLEEQLNEHQSTLKKKEGELGDLLKMLQQKDSDSRTIQAIKDLHASDPKWREVVEKLDKRLKGEEVELEPEKVDSKEPEDLSKVKDLLKSTQSKLEEQNADLRSQMILDRVDRLVDRYFTGLPKEYNDEDRRLLQETLSDHIDWDAISTNPDDLSKQVTEGIQKCLNWYGTPKGSLAAKTKSDASDADSSQQHNPPDPKARLTSLLQKDYGKTQFVETPAGKRAVPVVSDDEYVRELAEALRLSRNAMTARG